MRTRTRWIWTTALVAVVVAGAAIAIWSKKGERDASKKRERPALEFSQRDVVSLQRKRLSIELAVPGSVQAVSQATVRAKLSAEVKRVLVREGDRVTSSQPIAEFDTAQLRAQMAERKATLESARAQLAMAGRTRESNAQLVKQNFISQNAFDTADSAHQVQLAAVATAQAQMELTQLSMTDAVVRAPISGTVSKRHVQPGEKVSFDAPLLSIVDLTQLEVQAQVPISDVTQIRKGMPTQVDVEGVDGRKFEGRVERINPSAEPGTRTINIYVSLSNEDMLLKAGMFARVLLTVAPEVEVPALPLSAVRTEAAQTFVWIVADEKLARRNIVVGKRDERAQLVEVTSGLAPGEVVLATKFDNLKDGLAAKVISQAADSSVADEERSAPARN
ncbi:MAG TPA: efflux RND transporter periplasmic adaptor subunit [Burkholderiaceae bacterium]|nr:efflux RND transporter periplasmic adaptor subunit [Burkholderiaceae bacterium]